MLGHDGTSGERFKRLESKDSTERWRRTGAFEPALMATYQRRFPGFDDKIIALYTRGMSARDIQAHVSEPYGIAISLELVSAVTGSVIDEVRDRAL